MKEFAGRVAFVTGGASGIGLGMARSFAARGMRVALADIEATALDEAVGALRATGAEAVGIRCDVADAGSLEAAGREALAAFGRLHVVCNNAGVSPMGALADCSLADWQWAIGVNLMGVVHGIKSLVPHIVAHGEGGHVVNTASIAGLVALPTLGIYTATKYAVVGISETLRAELSPHGIGVSVLCPAFVRTRLAESARNRPPGLGPTGPTPDFVRQAIESGMEPEEVGRRVVRAIEEDRLYVMTHPESKLGFEVRAGMILESFSAG